MEDGSIKRIKRNKKTIGLIYRGSRDYFESHIGSGKRRKTESHEFEIDARNHILKQTGYY